jgi:hypothetical protein
MPELVLSKVIGGVFFMGQREYEGMSLVRDFMPCFCKKEIACECISK